MSMGSVHIGGKSLVSIKDAATSVSYSRDYLTRLARENKIVAANINRRWYVDLDSLQRYEEQAEMERELRKDLLRKERQQECELKESVAARKAELDNKAKGIHMRAVVASSLVGVAGLLSGVMTYDLLLSGQLAQVPAAVTEIAVSGQDVREVAVESERASAVDTGLRPAFTREVRMMDDALQNGVLVLPSTLATSSIERLFSDKVEVRRSLEGEPVLVQLNGRGEMVGDPIPFVLAPVSETAYVE